MSNLFRPIQLSGLELSHRLVLPPLTRLRVDSNNVPMKIVTEYYNQRSKTPGSLLISEANLPSKKSGDMVMELPGIWSEEQIKAWAPVAKAVHDNKSYIFMQFFALGRQVHAETNKKKGIKYVSSSSVPMDDKTPPPAELTKDEIKEYVADFVQASKNAIRAGFDGIEIHGANGYLLDQFLHENTNKRTDEYGGSIENRARFVLEVVDAVVKAIGASKVGIRLSPWGSYGNVDPGLSPIPQWSYLIHELQARALRGDELAYVHVVEPRIDGTTERDQTHRFAKMSNLFVRQIWPGHIITAGGYDRESAIAAADADDKLLVAIGRPYISNPDLPARLRDNVPLQPYDRSGFYSKSPDKYITYKPATNY